MTTSGTIILGVISGVLSSALVFLVVQAFRKIMRPWFAEIIYRGVDISGRWRFDSDEAAQLAFIAPACYSCRMSRADQQKQAFARIFEVAWPHGGQTQ